MLVFSCWGCKQQALCQRTGASQGKKQEQAVMGIKMEKKQLQKDNKTQ